eukprot:6869394-Pyramimonas_sp.AAC.1
MKRSSAFAEQPGSDLFDPVWGAFAEKGLYLSRCYDGGGRSAISLSFSSCSQAPERRGGLDAPCCGGCRCDMPSGV